MKEQNKIKSRKSRAISYTGERLVGDNKLLAPQRSENLARFRYFQDLLSEGVVLDFGCGAGEGTYYLSTLEKFQVIGIDISFDAIQNANLTYNNKRLAYLCGDILAPSFKQNLFDGIISVEVIEHIHEAGKYLSNVKRLLKKEGVFMLTTPNRLISSPTPGSLWPDHVIEYDPDELQNILETYFSSVKILGEHIPVYENNVIRKMVHKVSPIFKPILPKWLRIRTLPFLFSLIKSDLDDHDIVFTDQNIKACPTLVAVCRQIGC